MIVWRASITQTPVKNIHLGMHYGRDLQELLTYVGEVVTARCWDTFRLDVYQVEMTEEEYDEIPEVTP